MSQNLSPTEPQEKANALSSPRLSLCMMVKNEAETLEKCLELARPHVDEIVVVDTGSTDGTQAIAQRYADVYDEIEWPNSFALARNHTFDLATGDFILVLDGDEYLPDQAHWAAIRRKLVGREDLACVQLQVRNLLGTSTIIAADVIWQERIFRNHPQLRYKGRVHHQIVKNLSAYVKRTGHKIEPLKAEIIHTGYALAQDKMQAKYRARLELLEAEYTEARVDAFKAYYGYQLAVVHFVMDDWQKALDVFAEIDFSRLSPQNAYYSHLLASHAAINIKNVALSLIHCNEMLTLEPNEPMGYYSTGVSLLMANQIGNGMLMLMEAYNINEDGESIRFVVNAPLLLKLLSRICVKVGLHDHAVAFRALHEKQDPNPKIVKALIVSLKTSIVRAEMEMAQA